MVRLDRSPAVSSSVIAVDSFRHESPVVSDRHSTASSEESGTLALLDHRLRQLVLATVRDNDKTIVDVSHFVVVLLSREIRLVDGIWL